MTKAPPERLTKRQAEYLRALGEVLDRATYKIPLREIAKRIGKPHPALVQMLAVLERKGWIARGDDRGIEILHRLADMAPAPVEIAGTVGAGLGVVGVDAPAEIVELRSIQTRRTGYQYARVNGDSMVGDCILSGDVALVREQPSVDQGEIGLFLLPDGTLTIKRHRITKGRLFLVPSNPRMEPIEAPRGTVVRGKVIRVIRDLE
jgi:repressor LexA